MVSNISVDFRKCKITGKEIMVYSEEVEKIQDKLLEVFPYDKL